MIKTKNIVLLTLSFLVADTALASVAGPPVPEMDVAGVPIVLGLTIALVLVLKDRFTK